MSSTLDAAADALRRAISELDEERRRLEAALRQLEGDGRGSGGRGRTGRRRIAQRGERLEQMRRVLRENPGIKASEAARLIGITPTHAYGLIRRLRERGELPPAGEPQPKGAGESREAAPTD